MPGLTHALDIARRAMAAQQSIMSVIGHNVANANTPGYTRQVANLAAEVPSQWGTVSFGNGVSIESVQRKRDVCLDQELRLDMAGLGRWQCRAGRLTALEDMINEPSDASLGAAMDAFWNSWSELSSDPDDMTRRAAVREQGRSLSASFQNLVQRLGQVGRGIDSEIQIRAAEFNLILSNLRELNVQVRETELRGLTANDLRDRRDLLLDQMSQLAPVTYSESDDGVLSVRLATTLVLNLTVYRPLEALVEEELAGGGRITLQIEGQGSLEFEGGSLGGLIEMRRETIPALIEEIDLLASDMISGINGLHRAGPSRVDFFAGTGAEDMAVSAEIEENLEAINTSTSGLPGDNDIALAITQLRDSRIVAMGTATPREYWDSVVGRLGVTSRQAQFQEESLTLTTQALEQRRRAGSGVSLDEEMANILIAQQAFVAAVRVYEAVGDMMDVLMGI